MTSLADLLAEGEADEPIVYVSDQVWTRGEIRERASAIAAALTDAGVQPGEPVGVTLPNGAELVAALFGVWQHGAVYVPMNPRLTASEVDHILDAVAPTAAIVDAASASRFDDLPAVVSTGAGLEVRPGLRRDTACHPSDVALIQFTSGTTGRPKPVLLLHSGVLTLIDGVLAKIRGKGAAKASTTAMPNLIPVSLSLWAGIYNVLFALRVDAPVVLMEQFDPTTFADLVRRYDIRSTVLPPAAMTMLTDDDTIDDLAPLKYVRSITAPLSPLQAHRFKDRFGIAVLNSYGQTEIGGEIVGWNAADSRAHGSTKLGAVGRPHDGVELRTDAGSGELQVRTPAMSAGYADGSDLGDRLTDDGWFRTGDIARIDDDGFVWIEGRVSDMINRGGLKVFPGEVEEVIRLSPAVADVAVVAIPDERLGEVPWAFIVVRDGVVLEPDDLEQLCRANLAPYKVPARFEPLDALPRNEVGKVVHADLRALAG